MLYSANILIHCSTRREPPTLVRHGNSRPVRGVLVLRPITVGPTSKPGASIKAIIVVSAIIDIISRTDSRKGARKQKPQPE